MATSRNSSWLTQKYEISSLCVTAGVSFQGRCKDMEDSFKIVPNICGTDISIYGIFDGHAGNFASQYASDIIVPHICDTITNVLNLIGQKNSKNESQKNEICNEEHEIIANPLEKYITVENKINYESLLRNEILNADLELNDRLSKAIQFCGTTFCLVLVDISNNLIICANVGDSRAILCDLKNNAVPLSFDHKPNNPDELERIQKNGGFISNKEGCWRVEGSLAISRTLGDYPLKQKKIITAEPDFVVKKYKDFKFFPKFIILASDGLWDVISNQEACDYVKDKLKDHHYGARSLIKKAYARRSEDNISVIIIRFIKPKPIKQRSSFNPYAGTYEWLM